jgi:hypothetical protein
LPIIIRFTLSKAPAKWKRLPLHEKESLFSGAAGEENCII